MTFRSPKRLKSFQTPSHARSREQEAELADRVGGRTTRGSGCGSDKGDVARDGIARIEAKTTKNQSFSVTKRMVKKIEEEAARRNELPFIEVELDNQGTPLKVAVLPSWALELLMGVAKDATTQ